MMKVIMIAAVEQNNGIGVDNTIPWKLKEDMQHFKRETTGNTVIMGRRTFQSLGSKPLPDRHNIVISSQMTPGIHYMQEVGNGYKVFATLASAMHYLKGFCGSELHTDKIFIIGGAKLYEEGMQFAAEILLTRIDKEFSCDTFFPVIPSAFRLVDSKYVTGIDFDYSFNQFVRQP